MHLLCLFGLVCKNNSLLQISTSDLEVILVKHYLKNGIWSIHNVFVLVRMFLTAVIEYSNVVYTGASQALMCTSLTW